MKSASPVEQTPEQMGAEIEEFFAAHERVLMLEDGRPLFDFVEAKYSLTTEHGRCTLHCWSEERNVVRRVVATKKRKGELQLFTLRFGQTKPQLLELVSDPDRRTQTAREQSRVRYLPRIERVLRNNFPNWVIDPFSTAMDLEKSFGPAYARGVMHSGQQAWAVVGVNAEESPATVDGVLTIGILWLQHCRDHGDGRRLFQGLRIVVPKGLAQLTLSRMQWLRTDAAKWELYEFDERNEVLIERDACDTGNLATRLPHAPDEQAAKERFGDAVARVMELVPASYRDVVEQRLRSSTHLALLLHGLEFARVRQTVSANSFNRVVEITVGAGANETPLTDESEPMLRAMLERLFDRRRPGGSVKDPLYRMQPERWLESMLRRDIAVLTAGANSFAQLDAEHVYAQVPAFAAADHGMIDLLTVTRDGRLAVLELKANEDMHFALQALDYWVRVRWHHTQTVDASTGLGALQQHGFFPSLRLRSEAPLLFLVAPSLRVHPATETVLRYLKAEVEWTIVALSEKWREGPKVIFRKRSRGQKI
ncbi:MAG: hypothetical protein JSS87_07935 [Acidobacteria bacterium]|nr:hypothetical protein [Acidobacteriota bacterium]